MAQPGGGAVNYYEALNEAIRSAKPAIGRREELKAVLVEINAQLKGPLPDAERIMLVGDRRDIRLAIQGLAAK